jgi:tetratricopeptide (TPR) repeat protein/transcriptional regulator with XRE-family HTH domain
MQWRRSAPFGELLTKLRTRRHVTQAALATALGAHRNTIGRWERGEGLPETRGMVLELARLLHLTERETRQLLETSLTALVPFWTVPLPRNTCFTGRDALLHRLHTQLVPTQPGALSQTVALTGLGGIGKTQLALEYAYRYGLKYTAVFWLAAETAESLMTSMQQIAEQLQLPERQAPEQSQVVAAAQRWLTRHADWLMIADNVDDLELLHAVLPSSRHGALLLTTRRPTLGTLAEVVEVAPMHGEEGITLVLQRAHLLTTPLAAAEAVAAAEVVAYLEGLPLALDQAGAYIDETQCGVAEYLRRYQHQRAEVLARRGIHGGAHPDSVTTTFLLSAQHLDQERPAAIHLLRLCAFLHPESIPEELLLAALSQLGVAAGSLETDAAQFDLALAALRSASLVKRHPETRTLSIHRLVQAVLADQMEPAEGKDWIEHILRVVNAAFPDGQFGTWAQCERYLAQALACLSAAALAGSSLPETGELLCKAGSYLMERGRYSEAGPLLEQAAAMEERQPHPDYPTLLSRRLKQVELYFHRGRYAPAELLLHQMIASGEHHLEPTHRLIAEMLHTLAAVYQYQRKYEQAEALYQRVLHLTEPLWGSEDPGVATILNNLGVVYRHQGKYEQAEALYQRVLHIREQRLGSDHPDTVSALHNLASLYRHQGKYEQAEVLCQQVVRIDEQVLGAEHPDTALSLTNLAMVYGEQGKWDEAEALYQRVLHIQDVHLGAYHLDTAATRRRLAWLYQHQGRYEQAESLLQRAVAIHEQQLGAEHPDTVVLRQEYQRLLSQQSQTSEAAHRELQEHAQTVPAGVPAGVHPHSPSLHDAVENMHVIPQQETDPLHAFLRACCEQHPHAWCRASELWQAYQCWVEEQQEPFSLSRRALTAALKARGYRADRTNVARLWRGIGLIHMP